MSARDGFVTCEVLVFAPGTFDARRACLPNFHHGGSEMATISKEASLATVINVFTVAPERQQQLASMLAKATTEAAQDMPGFVSATIHCSDDRTRVANYAQWRRREDLEAALASP